MTCRTLRFCLGRATGYVFLMMAAAHGTTLSAQTAALSLGSATGQPGKPVSLPVSLTNNGAQTSGLMWTFAYSAADFSSVSVSAGSAGSAAGKSVSCAPVATGRMRCILVGANSSLIANGPVATAQFTVASTTSVTSSSIQLLESTASSNTGSVIGVSATGATIGISRSTALSALSCSPTSVSATGLSTCTVTLTSAAPSTGFPVTMGYSASGVTLTMPTSLTVPAGATSATFSVQFKSATTSSTVQISATGAGQTKYASISVSTSTSTPTSPTDTYAPVISNVRVVPYATYAVVMWTTNEASDSKVEYGKSTDTSATVALSPTRTTTHSVTLYGLVRGTSYYYRVSSTDAAGNKAVNPTSGGLSFRTAY